MKAVTVPRSLRFTEFFLALAYCFENITLFVPKEERELVRKFKIKKVFLPLVWSVCKKKKCDHCGDCSKQKKRTEETIVFLRDCFFNHQDQISFDLLKKFKDYFSVEEIPGAHIVLNRSCIVNAKKYFEIDPEGVSIAAGEILRRYLEHREKDRGQFGDQKEVGFGLVLCLDGEY